MHAAFYMHVDWTESKAITIPLLQVKLLRYHEHFGAHSVISI